MLWHFQFSSTIKDSEIRNVSNAARTAAESAAGRRPIFLRQPRFPEIPLHVSRRPAPSNAVEAWAEDAIITTLGTSSQTCARLHLGMASAGPVLRSKVN